MMRKQNTQLLGIGILSLIIAGILMLSLSGYINPILNNVSSPVVSLQTWVSTRFTAIYEFFTVPRDVASLRQRNQELEAELSNLQTQIITLQQQINETKVLYALLDFARENPSNKYRACSVIGRDPVHFCITSSSIKVLIRGSGMGCQW